MVDLGLRHLERVVACVADTDAECRASVARALSHAGIGDVRAHENLDSLCGGIEGIDVIILGDNLGPEAWRALRALRHHHLNASPFAIVTCLVAADDPSVARAAQSAGADDVMPRTTQEDQILLRLRRSITQRPTFIASSNYVGPERRASARERRSGRSVARVNVPNPVLAKTDGVTAVGALTLDDLLRTRLNAHGYRIGFLAQRLRHDTANARGYAAEIDAVLADAIHTAAEARDPAVSWICESLRASLSRGETRVEAVAEIAAPLLRMGVSSVAAVAEAAQGAATFASRPREVFAPIVPIRGHGTPTPLGLGSAIDVHVVKEGDTVFAQGHAADAVYLLAQGRIALYRERNGAQSPVANVRKGEAFGDMALSDGSAYRVTAVALEPSILAVITRAEIASRMKQADPDFQHLFKSLAASLASVHEVYSPRSRHIADSIAQMSEEADAISGYLTALTSSHAAVGEVATLGARLRQLTSEVIALISAHPGLDRRTRALPASAEPLPSDGETPSEA